MTCTLMTWDKGPALQCMWKTHHGSHVTPKITYLAVAPSANEVARTVLGGVMSTDAIDSVLRFHPPTPLHGVVDTNCAVGQCVRNETCANVAQRHDPVSLFELCNEPLLQGLTQNCRVPQQSMLNADHRGIPINDIQVLTSLNTRMSPAEVPARISCLPSSSASPDASTTTSSLLTVHICSFPTESSPKTHRLLPTYRSGTISSLQVPTIKHPTPSGTSRQNKSAFT